MFKNLIIIRTEKLANGVGKVKNDENMKTGKIRMLMKLREAF
jgi:hypothetical protein